ncbi:tRNA (guanosine(37)-N1)-methyltransferase TrmD [candidate division WWE3 bacterium CG08_land_8_20_14_0_20_43_13]|uniref:tRNA (guanine-N(1)-)-methyltransferase n=1 Tax=candidate division WWE3 bacterium CG08_land_8_20_14_0_20_43_13 TaxID=1975087 RepID=A0A2H0X7I9_UNCKA|nr:MAG: tRNA (guanosine(37)-N1)-methyltransferase TrmD [candidate division WWE3 bacterium CG08_land_8_20_14_0_20_43_13]
MLIDIITLFPDFFVPVFSQSIIGRAQQKELVKIRACQLRDWAVDAHGSVDDKPFGGGVGMVLRPEPLFEAVEFVTKNNPGWVVFLTPGGRRFEQKKAIELSQREHLVFICGHYEGIDQRVIDELVNEQISLGDFVLTGGEIPTMAVVDALVRLLPGVLEKLDATVNESFSLRDEQGCLLLEYPQYTRPADYRGLKVPEVLLSGDHARIAEWKKTNSRLKMDKKV